MIYFLNYFFASIPLRVRGCVNISVNYKLILSNIVKLDTLLIQFFFLSAVGGCCLCLVLFGFLSWRISNF